MKTISPIKTGVLSVLSLLAIGVPSLCFGEGRLIIRQPIVYAVAPLDQRNEYMPDVGLSITEYFSRNWAYKAWTGTTNSHWWNTDQTINYHLSRDVSIGIGPSLFGSFLEKDSRSSLKTTLEIKLW